MFQAGDVRGWVEPAEPRPGFESRIALYCAGAFVTHYARNLFPTQVTGAVNYDRFTLNASQSGVIEDAQARFALALFEGQVRRLLTKTIRAQVRAMPSLARLLFSDPSLLKIWGDRLDGKSPGPPSGLAEELAAGLAKLAHIGSSKRLAREKQVRLEAARALWLRAACLQSTADERLNSDDRRELAGAPLWLSAAGRPLSLADLRRMYTGSALYVKRPGFLKVSSHPMEPGSSEATGTVWLTSVNDEHGLRRVFHNIFPFKQGEKEGPR